MSAIYRRELMAYFTSPIGYVFSAVFFAISGVCFTTSTIGSGTTDSTSYFAMILLFFVILIPLLTMKLFSDDKRNRTDQILLTSPVSVFGIVMGKYLAAITVFGATFVVNSFNFLLLFSYGEPNFVSIFVNILGIFLLGAAFVAIGLFLSSLTENQLIAAVSAMGVNAAMLLISAIAGKVDSQFWRMVIKFFSVWDRFTPFTNQMLDLSAIIYYLSLAAVAIFLTTRVIEKRRWA